MRKKKFKIKFGLKILPICENYTPDEDKDLSGGPAGFSKYMKTVKWRDSVVNGKVGQIIRGNNFFGNTEDDYLAVIYDKNFHPEKYVRIKHTGKAFKITAIYGGDEIYRYDFEPPEEYPGYFALAGFKGKKLL